MVPSWTEEIKLTFKSYSKLPKIVCKRAIVIFPWKCGGNYPRGASVTNWFHTNKNYWTVSYYQQFLAYYHYGVSGHLLKRTFSSAIDVFGAGELCGVCEGHRESKYAIITFFNPPHCFSCKCAQLRPDWPTGSPRSIGIFSEANTPLTPLSILCLSKSQPSVD